MDSGEAFLCHQCGKMFYRLSTLESHTKWKHMEKSNEFMCDQCGRTFQKKYNLLKHLESGIHDFSESVKCALCEFRAQNRKIMGEHYQHFHGISLKESNAYFKTADEFYLWKIEFESQTKSRFVKMSSSRKRKNGFIRSTFFCHRDGNFIPKGRNLRHLKVKGSNKINAHCPAKMDVDIGERIVIVSYITTHLGHEMDVTRMTLDISDRAAIANKLAHRVPFEQILDEINSPPKDSDLKRVNYLTRKDLWNIVDTFKINPKNVVYSKTRLRRKKKMEKPKKESKNKRIGYKHLNQKTNNTDGNEIVINNEEEVECTDSQVNAMNEGDDENIILCPVLKEENEEYIQEYALISDETGEDASTYYIINAEGELESISGRHVIYTEDGEVKLGETSGEVESEELTQPIDDISELVTLEEINGQDHPLKSDLTTVKKRKRNQVTIKNTSPINNSFHSNLGASNNSFLPKRKLVDINIVDCSENKPGIEMLKTEKEIDCDSDIQLKENISNVEVTNEQITITGEELEVENNPEYEVTIENYEEEQGEANEYVIISTDEDFDQCAVISNISDNEQEFDQFNHPLETMETVMVVEQHSEDPTIKEEVVDTYLMDEEECIPVLEEKPQWNEKRKEVLHKLLNVHNMINNEQQLKVFSKNISSLEHVLKALSKSEQPSPQSSGCELVHENSKQDENPKNSCR
uniref:C2H2-type domain-containing protein n=1 Tax=Graphocephala atropunctata TaxID=36148 RepID=A0A1B6KQD4_9HEMI